MKYFHRISFFISYKNEIKIKTCLFPIVCVLTIRCSYINIKFVFYYINFEWKKKVYWYIFISYIYTLKLSDNLFLYLFIHLLCLNFLINYIFNIYSNFNQKFYFSFSIKRKLFFQIFHYGNKFFWKFSLFLKEFLILTFDLNFQVKVKKILINNKSKENIIFLYKFNIYI